MNIRDIIDSGRIYLGIELGSTRIKASLIDDMYKPIADGSFSWENEYKNGIWTYSLDNIHNGIQSCYRSLCDNVYEKYDTTITKIAAIGISGMMHGYMAFDSEDKLLVPFRTWRNTITEQAAEELTSLLGFNIPQRWSISHLYQAALNREAHLSKLVSINTLAGYIHKKLTGRSEVGVGEASGIFPIENGSYNESYIDKIQHRLSGLGFPFNLHELMPAVRNAGDEGAFLTEDGARFLDPAGNLEAGIPVCPPEGDAGTGMVATNSVLPRTGNISAGTSIFSMLVLEKPLSTYYTEIDMVTTPDGAPVAMVHCNNCCGELDAWINMFNEFAELTGCSLGKSALYELLYQNAFKSTAGNSNIVTYNYISGEPVTGLQSGKPMYFRNGDTALTLGSFFKAQLYSAIASLKIGMDILFDNEKVSADGFTGHGGLFKVKGVAQQIMADALNTPVTIMETAGEGGAWGMALLAAFMINKNGRSLADFLSEDVFSQSESETLLPDKVGHDYFESFMSNYKTGLSVQRAAAEL